MKAPPLDTNAHAITQVIDCPGVQLLRYDRGFTDAELNDFLNAASRDIEKVAQGARFVMIIDVNKADRGSSVQRELQARWQTQHEAYFQKHVIAGVFVAGSALLRGALRAVGWFQPYPYKTHIEADIDGAIKKAVELLEQDGQKVPSDDELELLRAVYR